MTQPTSTVPEWPHWLNTVLGVFGVIGAGLAFAFRTGKKVRGDEQTETETEKLGKKIDHLHESVNLIGKMATEQAAQIEGLRRDVERLFDQRAA